MRQPVNWREGFFSLFSSLSIITISSKRSFLAPLKLLNEIFTYYPEIARHPDAAC
jgi:hypothetical protein